MSAKTATDLSAEQAAILNKLLPAKFKVLQESEIDPPGQFLCMKDFANEKWFKAHKTTVEKAFKNWHEPQPKNLLQKQIELSKWQKASSQVVEILPKRQSTPSQKYLNDERDSKPTSKAKVKAFSVKEEKKVTSKKKKLDKEKESKQKKVADARAISEVAPQLNIGMHEPVADLKQEAPDKPLINIIKKLVGLQEPKSQFCKLQEILMKSQLKHTTSESGISERETQISKAEDRIDSGANAETTIQVKPAFVIPEATKRKICQAIARLTFAQKQVIVQVVKFDTQRDAESGSKHYEFTLDDLSMSSIVKIERLCDKFALEN